MDNERDEPVIKGPGVSDSNPLCLPKWFKKIVVEHHETRFDLISDSNQQYRRTEIRTTLKYPYDIIQESEICKIT
jgi:hypothetical protein